MATAKTSTEIPPKASLADLIEQARVATETANNLQAQADQAKAEARGAYDALYAQLAQLKADAKDIDTFKSSKLGQLLQNARG